MNTRMEFVERTTPPGRMSWVFLFWNNLGKWSSPLVLLLILTTLSYAGGPHFVAGVSYFNSGTKGTPLTWAQGTINYYTDQGDLSPLLPHASADAFVADAFTRWTFIPNAAVSATLAGQLGEDVNSSNVYSNSDGTISMPLDILPSASLPVAVVYDADGSVTTALLGQGAGGSSYCSSNAAFGGPDNFSADANFLHALVIVNGNCAQTSAQLPDLKYSLVRLLGRVFGLDWSQTNLNVITGKPTTPTTADYAGFSIMHALDPSGCVPVSKCFVNADQPKMDDQAALAQLYPVTTQNQFNFPGKQLLFENTVRIHGSVYFTDVYGQPTQPMQGVNVVARWIDPSTGLPSRTYVATAVSGSLFRGNAGNPVTGYEDGAGQSFDRFGSDDPTVEGSFDLAGLQIPNGANSAQYQLSVEAIDPQWSVGVGPYGSLQVKPSGTAQPVTLTINKGGDVQQDILMLNSATAKPDWFEPTTYASPAPVPPGGEWSGALSGYGNVDYFRFNGQANRTMSVEVTALDEAGITSQSKAQPVIGMWSLVNPGSAPAPANTPSAFNTVNFGVTRLDAALFQSTDFRIGVSDIRGDVRPDFRYRARVFYGDNVTPVRASVGGKTVVAVQGYGFRTNTTAVVTSTSATMLASSGNQLLLSTPPLSDGVKDVTLRDPATGASSVLTGVLTYGAGPNDTLLLIYGMNPSTPVGAVAPNPIVVQALAPDGITPVIGASVFLTATPAVSFSTCGGAASCTVLTDQSGIVSTRVTVLSAGTATITAQLAPASYNPAQQVQATVFGISSSLAVILNAPNLWVAQGATLDVPLAARVLSSGAPITGATITYSLTSGSGTLNPASTVTDSNGNASANLHLSAFASEVDGSACVTVSGILACQSFAIFPVLPSAIRLQIVGGNLQEINVGQSFQPLTVRVTDSASPPHPVLASAVVFQSVIGRSPNNEPVLWLGNSPITRYPMPVILGSSQTAAVSDASGLAALQPTSAGIQGPVLILGTASAGSSSLLFAVQSLNPVGH